MKRLLPFLVFGTLALLMPQRTVSPVQANNGLPYNTYTYSTSREQLIQTQDAYVPLSTTRMLGDYTLNSPQDIVISSNDVMYIADEGNKSIVKFNLLTDEVTVIGEGILNRPRGLHVDDHGRVYVADFGNKMAYQFSQVNNEYVVTATYEKPVNTPFFDEADAFDPTKIVTDKGDNVYVLLSGNINGLAQFKNDGEFFGYFGGNRIPSTFDNTIRSLLFDEETRREFFQIIPKPVYNVSVDQSGLILTTTKQEDGYLKLNIANVIFNQSVWGFDTVEDVTVGPYNTIYTITSEGYIVEYDPNGSVLFLFSGPDQVGQKGLFQNARGIAVDSQNNLYAVDSGSQSLQIFIPTEFASLVHTAIDLYFDGKYAESLIPWQEVLKQNRLFDLANQGLGDAYFALQDYETALTYYRIARDRMGYSNAYWEVRNAFLLDYGDLIVIGLMVLIGLSFFSKFIPGVAKLQYAVAPLKEKISGNRWVQQFMFPFSVFNKPVDGYDDLKRYKRFSNRMAFVYLALFFLTYTLWIYETNFLFNPRIVSEINLFEEFVTILVPFGLWVISNYLVGSIRDGDGKLKEVFQGSALTLLPLVIMFPILTVLSHALTFNESFIYDVVLLIGISMTVIYFFVMVKEIHFYDIRPTVSNIFITLFTGVMMLAMTFIVFFLLGEVFNLFADIFQEVFSRV